MLHRPKSIPEQASAKSAAQNGRSNAQEGWASVSRLEPAHVRAKSQVDRAPPAAHLCPLALWHTDCAARLADGRTKRRSSSWQTTFGGKCLLVCYRTYRRRMLREKKKTEYKNWFRLYKNVKLARSLKTLLPCFHRPCAALAKSNMRQHKDTGGTFCIRHGGMNSIPNVCQSNYCD